MSLAIETPVLIARKRDGGTLTAAELEALVGAYLHGEVEDAQMAAFLMAGVIRGFSRDEAVALTEALVASGEQVDLSTLSGPTVDKHSTGGVGDTTTLVVAPLLAAAGAQVAKLSGRGLGHTGGTLDKLESIPGLRVDLEAAAVRDQVERIGLAVAAATQDLVPADKRLYALRDVTATVASPALIAASVMSKKLAGGADHVMLDVKTGDGAFMAEFDEARALAELCVEIGEAHGRRTAALVTDMSQPLGDGVGNAIEVGVAVEVLQGRRSGRLAALSVDLAASALALTGIAPGAARDRIEGVLTSGAGLEKFREFVSAQGGDPTVADQPWKVLPRAAIERTWVPSAGVVTGFACRRLGELAAVLGAGRMRQDDVLDPAVGIEILVRIGDEVDGATPAVRVLANDAAVADRVLTELPDVVQVGEEAAPTVPLVRARLGVPEG